MRAALQQHLAPAVRQPARGWEPTERMGSLIQPLLAPGSAAQPQVLGAAMVVGALAASVAFYLAASGAALGIMARRGLRHKGVMEGSAVIAFGGMLAGALLYWHTGLHVTNTRTGSGSPRLLARRARFYAPTHIEILHRDSLAALQCQGY